MTMIEDCGRESYLTYCRTVVFSFISITLLILLVYSNSFDCSWHFDDTPNIVENPRLHMKEISWESIKSAIFSDRNNPHFPYRPVACLSFALNYYFGRLNVFGYHVVNLLIHLISSIFLFLFVYRTLLYLTSKKRWSGDPYFVALLATVLWAINPVQTQAVTYIVQRMASMAAMFYIMGMYLYLKARTSTRKEMRFLLFLACFLSYCLALGSKENAALFPLSILLYEILILQQDPVLFLRKHWVLMVIVFAIPLVIAIGYFYLKTGDLLAMFGGYHRRAFTLSERLMTQPRILLFYISLLFYPMPSRLSIIHDIPVSTSLLNPISTLLSILFLVVLIAGAVLMARRHPLISFCILFFFLNHLVESSIFPLELMFEHRNYLPAMLLFVLPSVGLVKLLQLYQRKPLMKCVFCGFMVAILIAFGHSTFMRNFTWKNEESLWIDAVDKSPELWRPYHNLAKYYSDIGESEKATAHYIEALSKRCAANKFDKYLTYYNLGHIHYKKEDYNKAKWYYEKSIGIYPKFSDAHNNLGIILANENRPLDALREFKRALRLNYKSLHARSNLGFLLVNMNRAEEGILDLKRELKMSAANSQILKRLGVAYIIAGQFEKAIALFEKILQKEKAKGKSNPITALFLAQAYHLSGKEELATEVAQTVVPSFDANGLERFLDNLHEGQNRLDRLLPDEEIVLPVLSKAFKNKAKQLDQMADRLKSK